MPKLYLLFVFCVLVIYSLFRLNDVKSYIPRITSGGNYLSCYDCYYYADLVFKKLQGANTGIDYLRNVPDFSIVDLNQLIVLLPYALSKLFGVDTNYLIAFLPPVGAFFFIVPLTLWLKKFSNVYTVIGASVVGLFNYLYWYRTSFGRFDTDFLLLTFVFLILIFITKSVESERRAFRVAYIILAGLTFKLFMWWYPKPVLIVVFLTSALIGAILWKLSLIHI